MKDLARCVVLAMFLVAIASPAWGQRARGNQRGGSNIENVVYLQGRVVIEDGAEPPDLVVVERVCMGQVFPEGFSEPNGRFSVRVGSNASGAMEDASTYGTDSRGRASGDTIRVGGITGDSERFSSMKNQGTVDLIGCDLQIRLDGFRTEAIPLARRNVFDNPDLGTIVLKRIAGLTGSTVSATSMTASKAAVKAFDKGRKELAKPGGDPAKAAKEFEKAVAAHGQHAGRLDPARRGAPKNGRRSRIARGVQNGRRGGPGLHAALSAAGQTCGSERRLASGSGLLREIRQAQPVSRRRALLPRAFAPSTWSNRGVGTGLGSDSSQP